MGRAPRCYEPDAIYELEIRTIQGRLLLAPTEACCAVILGVLGRALAMFPSVRLYGFIFMSNHVHMIASASDGRSLPDFLAYLTGNTSHRIGRLHDWSGGKWQGRWHVAQILDDASVTARLRYLLRNGVKEELVETPRDWPGATCVSALLSDMTMEARWLDGTAYAEARRRDAGVKKSDFETSYTIRLEPLPEWRELGAEQLRARYGAMVRQIEREEARNRCGRAVLGVAKLRLVHPHTRGKVLERSRAPVCHASCGQRRKRYVERRRQYCLAFAHASDRLREGVPLRECGFPPWCFPPGAGFQWDEIAAS